MNHHSFSLPFVVLLSCGVWQWCLYPVLSNAIITLNSHGETSRPPQPISKQRNRWCHRLWDSIVGIWNTFVSLNEYVWVWVRLINWHLPKIDVIDHVCHMFLLTQLLLLDMLISSVCMSCDASFVLYLVLAWYLHDNKIYKDLKCFNGSSVICNSWYD